MYHEEKLTLQVITRPLRTREQELHDLCLIGAPEDVGRFNYNMKEGRKKGKHQN
jgi:predicted MarR family transcription regulator